MAYRDELDAARARIAQLESELRGEDVATLRAERDAALLRIEALALKVRELESTLKAVRESAREDTAARETRIRTLEVELEKERRRR